MPKNVNIFPGDIELGTNRFGDGSIYGGIRFTDLDKVNSATILLSPEAMQHLINTLPPLLDSLLNNPGTPN